MQPWTTRRPTITGLYVCSSCLYKLSQHASRDRQSRLRSSLTTVRVLPLSLSQSAHPPQIRDRQVARKHISTTSAKLKDKSRNDSSSDKLDIPKPSLLQRVANFFTSKPVTPSGDDRGTTEHNVDNKRLQTVNSEAELQERTKNIALSTHRNPDLVILKDRLRELQSLQTPEAQSHRQLIREQLRTQFGQQFSLNEKQQLLERLDRLRPQRGFKNHDARQKIRQRLRQVYGVVFAPPTGKGLPKILHIGDTELPIESAKVVATSSSPPKPLAQSESPKEARKEKKFTKNVSGDLRRRRRAARERARRVSSTAKSTFTPLVADAPTETISEKDVDINHDQRFNSMKDAMLSPKPSKTSSQNDGNTSTEPPSLARRGSKNALLIQSLQPTELQFEALDVKQPPVPPLAHGLDRVLFNRGVHLLQDDASNVYNFDPYLQKVMSVADFDFNALKQYKTSSEDEVLSKVAQEYNRKYLGSTSSMTGSLNHFHFLLSSWRPLNMEMLSRGFDPGQSRVSNTFTAIQRAPSAMFLRYKNGVFAIDADKEFDDGNVLMLLGKSLEKLLTLPVSEFERYRKGDIRGVSEEERTSPESYHYSTQGDFLMRSQLDAYDSRLPGTGMFDLKTRAVLAVRMRSKEYQDMVGYQIRSQQGSYESYEREYYDMIRSTLLKYSLQARMGRMDGIFVAYHNVEEIFGFQYMNMSDIDLALHGQKDPSLGDQEFRYSIGLMNRILNEATARFPEQSLRFHFETRPGPDKRPPFMYIFAEPMSESEIDKIQSSQKARIAEFERDIMGVDLDEAATLKAKASDVAAAVAASRPSPTGDDEDAPVSTKSSTKTAHHAQKVDPNTSESSNLRPLLGFTLTVRSKINDIHAERPEKLRPRDRWDLEFSLQEIKPEAAAASYADTKKRRRLAFTKHDDEDEEGGAHEVEITEAERKKRARNEQYIHFLRKLSAEGAKSRIRREKEMEGKEKVVVGVPSTPAAPSQPVQEAAANQEDAAVDGEDAAVPELKIENVNEYMDWLYKDTRSRLPPPPVPVNEGDIEGTDDYMRGLYRKP